MTQNDSAKNFLKKKPVVSVIVPAYNSSQTIKACVSSILKSDFSEAFEVIVVDDGSTDNTVTLLNGLNVRVIRQKNAGAASARNNGARCANSDILIFADSDIEFFPDTLRRMHSYLSKPEIYYLTARYDIKPVNASSLAACYKALADYCYNFDMVLEKNERDVLIQDVMLGGGLEGYKSAVFFEFGGFNPEIAGADVEREELVGKIQKKYTLHADSSILTRHNFPDFSGIIKAYFFRTFNSMSLVCNKGYNQRYLKKNMIRVAFGAITTLCLMFSVLYTVVFRERPQITIPVVMGSLYMTLHRKMYYHGVKEYGLLFVPYIVFANLFFCLIISVAGFLGTLANLIKLQNNV